MTSTILLQLGLQGLTVTADRLSATADTVEESAIAFTEATNGKGWYVGTTNDTDTGLQRLVVKVSGTVSGSGWVYLTNSSPTWDRAYPTAAEALLASEQAEPGQGAPAVNATPLVKIAWLFKAWRNKKTQTATMFQLYDDAGTTVDQKATVSDDGTTTTVAEVATGP